MAVSRMRRVDGVLREVIGATIGGELQDPRIGFVTVTAVQTSPDLRTAQVHVSVLGTDEEKDATMKGLQASHGVIQKAIASQLMLLGPRAAAHTVCAGADEQYLRMGASALLRWHSCLALARAGYRANDLTDAALNPVTRFKSQLGAELTPTWSLTRGDTLMFRLESAVQRWRAAASRGSRAAAEDPE